MRGNILPIFIISLFAADAVLFNNVCACVRVRANVRACARRARACFFKNSPQIPFSRQQREHAACFPPQRGAGEANVQPALRGALRVTQHAAGLYYFPFGSLKHNYILTSSQP